MSEAAVFPWKLAVSDGDMDVNGDLIPGEALLPQVEGLVKDREAAYGPPDQHWGKAAAIANEYFGTDLFSPEVWGKLWVIDKLVRDGHVPGRDHLADIVGYVDGIDRLRGRR